MFQTKPVPICSAIAALTLACTGQLSASAAPADVLKVEIVADDMCCNGCARKIAAQLYAAPGVTSVEADLPSRVVMITAKASPKLTLERLWNAVEKGKGGPSKLETSQASYVLIRPSSLTLEQRSVGGRCSLTIRSMKTKENAQQIANQLYAVGGVKKVSVDVDKCILLVDPDVNVALSPWILAAAVQRARHQPDAILGPHGLLTIGSMIKGDSDTAARNALPTEGAVR
jgi:copper chaperone CopZ